ncbi:MAG TPA: hypothetical protein VFW11_15040 [Cyclobacteriaceae bacterium]|nr:hypothetical protein [Cyclobacteriaceae bacterium]
MGSSFSQEILVAPYIQPGNAPSFSLEEKILIWQTDSVPGKFKVEYTPGTITTDGSISAAKV